MESEVGSLNSRKIAILRRERVRMAEKFKGERGRFGGGELT